MKRDQEPVQQLLVSVRRFVREVRPPHGRAVAGAARLACAKATPMRALDPLRIVAGAAQGRRNAIARSRIKAAHA